MHVGFSSVRINLVRGAQGLHIQIVDPHVAESPSAFTCCKSEIASLRTVRQPPRPYVEFIEGRFVLSLVESVKRGVPVVLMSSTE